MQGLVAMEAGNLNAQTVIFGLYEQVNVVVKLTYTGTRI
jgi:hypothetical protein